MGYTLTGFIFFLLTSDRVEHTLGIRHWNVVRKTILVKTSNTLLIKLRFLSTLLHLGQMLRTNRSLRLGLLASHKTPPPFSLPVEVLTEQHPWALTNVL